MASKEPASKQADASKNVQRERKKRGEHRFYSVEDEQWEEQLRLELQKKKSKVIDRFGSNSLFM